MELQQTKSTNGVTCHECREWIRGGKIYFKHFWADYHMRRYMNFCVKCTALVVARTIHRAQNISSISRKLSKKYKTEDNKICSSCKKNK